MIEKVIDYNLGNITTIIFDVDGVLSASTIPVGDDGEPLRTVNIKDGYAIQLAVKMGLRLAIITGAREEAIARRFTKLGMKDIFLGCGRKIERYETYKEENAIKDGEIIYVGDDIPDYEVMKRCGCPCCPADAAPEIKELAVYVSPRNGGAGCVRDILEQVLKTQGKWLSTEKAFGW